MGEGGLGHEHVLAVILVCRDRDCGNRLQYNNIKRWMSESFMSNCIKTTSFPPTHDYYHTQDRVNEIGVQQQHRNRVMIHHLKKCDWVKQEIGKTHSINKAFRLQIISICLRVIDAYNYPLASAPLLRVAIGRIVNKITAWLMVDDVSTLTQSMSVTFVMAIRCGISAEKLYPDLSATSRSLVSETPVEPRHTRLVGARDNQLGG